MSTGDERSSKRMEVLPRGEAISEHGDGWLDYRPSGVTRVTRVVAAFLAKMARTS